MPNMTRAGMRTFRPMRRRTATALRSLLAAVLLAAVTAGCTDNDGSLCFTNDTDDTVWVALTGSPTLSVGE